VAEHKLKIWPLFFADVRDDRKPFEVRWNDRDYEVGDVLRLREWNPLLREYTGRETRKLVTYIADGSDRRGEKGTCFGIEPGYVVLGLKRAEA